MAAFKALGWMASIGTYEPYSAISKAVTIEISYLQGHMQVQILSEISYLQVWSTKVHGSIYAAF